MILPKGAKAPDFELNSSPDKKMKLSDMKGSKVILAFYPADWSPVCSNQMSLYNEMLEIFKRYHAEIIGISVDSKWCHSAFVQSRNIHFPLLADFEPKGKVSKEYGAYNETKGTSLRALFVIDENGIIQWSYLSPDRKNPGAEGIIEALDQMNQQKNKCK